MASRSLVLHFLFFCLFSTAVYGHSTLGSETGFKARAFTNDLLDHHMSVPFFLLREDKRTLSNSATPKKLEDHGIKENIPDRYRLRYQKWKDALLSTKFGQEMWASYSENDEFLLKIVVSSKRDQGAETSGYEWDDDGRLISATITLGGGLDTGFPDPVYYPVMNSLAVTDRTIGTRGDILASAKIAHEIGHVNFTAATSKKTFIHQNKMIEEYYKIFLNNGYDTKDPKLVMLTDSLGRQPLEIWEDREYWSEVVAMNYLLEKIGNEKYFCSVVSKVRANLMNYAEGYSPRFQPMLAFDRSSSPCL